MRLLIILILLVGCGVSHETTPPPDPPPFVAGHEAILGTWELTSNDVPEGWPTEFDLRFYPLGVLAVGMDVPPAIGADLHLADCAMRRGDPDTNEYYSKNDTWWTPDGEVYIILFTVSTGKAVFRLPTDDSMSDVVYRGAKR